MTARLFAQFDRRLADRRPPIAAAARSGAGILVVMALWQHSALSPAQEPPAPATQAVAETQAAAPPADAQLHAAQAPRPLSEVIDQQVAASLEAAGITPAALSSDAEFLRRVYLDLAGTTATPGEVRAFIDDKSPLKRQQLIDRLLNSPEYARQMQRVFDVMLMERRRGDRIPKEQWEEYLRDSLAANKPWDVLVREILSSDGVDPNLRPAARFYLDRDADAHLLTRDVGRLLLGRDMECAQCHDHPLVEGYLQADYYGLLAFFNRSFIFTPKDQQAVVLAEKADGDVTFKSVFTDGATDELTRPHLPGEQQLDEPAFESGQEYTIAPADGVRPVPKYSRRTQIAALLPRAENTAFRRNIANRLWALMMGRGLVHPLDMDHPHNPPSHPELLDVLADRFAAMNFDIKAFLRELALTQTYQRSSELPPGVEALPPDSLAVARLKPLSPEQLALAVSQATGITDIERAALGPSLNEPALHDRLAGNVRDFARTFKGQAGQAEQEFQATLEQILFMSNGAMLRSWISPQPGNLADRLTRISEPAAVADEMFLSVLSRRPTAEEVAELTTYLQSRANDRSLALQEWIWALVASDEFRFNH